MTQSSSIRKSHTGDEKLSSALEENHELFVNAFKHCSDLVFREIEFEQERAFLVFLDALIKADDLHENALKPLLLHVKRLDAVDETSTQDLEQRVITLSQVLKIDKQQDAINAVLDGNAVLFLDGCPEALILSATGGTRRGVEEPATEAVIRGPREGFTESLSVNLGLLRFKIKSASLKTRSFSIGEHTKTRVLLCYMENLVDPAVIEEVHKRLERIKIDGVLESAYIEEFIEDQPYSPFPQMQYSERPDTIAAQLLEGRFAIFVDGTPFVLTGPVTFWQFLQASEDYYERYIVANLLRWLRYVFLFLALYLPALYIAVTTFHQDMLPTSLLLSVATARESIPFPAIVEAFIMEIAFEALREAGIRLPKTVGQAVSILGALVIGQAAVQAGIVSAPMVIIVSLTGIASFTIPRYNASIAVRMLRFPMMVAAGLFGVFGLVIATMLLTVHLCHLRSFGVPYLSGITPFNKTELKDILVRTPWWNQTKRPSTFSKKNRKRLRSLKPSPENGSGGDA
ncbi:spore germination protein [Tumebacillus flagellatus]|uniref:Membrane protein n=1 Tax=Tumebacillus flagellatus TaxID=1157490 RepID=A0A074M9K7_9BACL|nr:spore germination protein [Tumebacillus flagellatus]KEO82597.1 membrane protein [Tumebacillus flagellatus]